MSSPENNFGSLSISDYILVKGARVNNLKNLSVAIPRNKFVVITGVSGSGKSSLAFDTIFAEGQRRYVESLSAYARQFLQKMDKPEVDYIKGLSPAMAIQQKTLTHNPRSTVGTSTEIYDYIKLLYARIGKTFSPVSGKEVKRQSVTDVVDFIHHFEEGTKLQLLIGLQVKDNRFLKEDLKLLLQKGFNRIVYKNIIYLIEDFLVNDYYKDSENIVDQSPVKNTRSDNGIYVLMDRFTVNGDDENNKTRIADSVYTAYHESGNECFICRSDDNTKYYFSNKFELDGISFIKPSPNLFSFNNPYGACTACGGFGTIIGIDEDLVVPNKTLSVYEDAISCWRGEKMKRFKEAFLKVVYKFDFPIHRPYEKLTQKQKQLLWEDNIHFTGIRAFFKWVEGESYKIQYKVLQSRYRGKTICPECNGTRLRKDAFYVKVGDKSISDIVLMPVKDVLAFFTDLKLTEHDYKIAKRLLLEINNRLKFLMDVGLDYLTLNRLSNSLSGGESQRIRLASTLGSSLVNSIYILDEPSIGLHPRDSHNLIKVLESLRDLGNTVVTVEHDEDIIKSADEIIDIGPLAGTHGGRLIVQGDYGTILKNQESLTSQYLNKHQSFRLQDNPRSFQDFIEVIGARENNLKNINVKFPLNAMVVVTGVSGSGKSSLIKKVLFAGIKKELEGFGEKIGAHDKITGILTRIHNIEMVDQNAIGISSRSNPVTYIKAYDDIRQLFADITTSKIRGYKSYHFSFNVDGGRCEACAGEGIVKVEMQFMADIYLPCENCKGKRFKDDILEVTYSGKNIADVLDLTVDEALLLFSDQKKIAGKLQVLADVGLGYIKLGQSSNTLSGGEAQRVKLAFFLSRKVDDKHTLFIFDEPTTGLHYHDIQKLLDSVKALIRQGNSVVIIEHNTEVVAQADWIIDLGPEGGEEGGHLVFEGTPDQLIQCENSYTGKFLKKKFKVVNNSPSY